MEQFPCKVMVTTLDRRKKYQTQKTYEKDSFFSVRYIRDDRSFHMLVKGGTKTEAFISSKLQVSNNILSLGSIALNVPEFRTMLLIECCEGPEHSDVLHKILAILSPQEQDIPSPSLPPPLSPTTTHSNTKENNSNYANERHNTSTPEKQCPQNIPEKKKLRSPLKTGFTPSKKKDRACCQHASPLKMTQKSSFLTAISSSACTTITSKESIAPDNQALTESQQKVLQRCKEGANVFLTGGAGTGKSYLLKCILQEMVALHGKQSVFVTATTGIAAVHIGGTTVHQFAGIRPSDTMVDIGDSFKQVCLLVHVSIL